MKKRKKNKQKSQTKNKLPNTKTITANYIENFFQTKKNILLIIICLLGLGIRFTYQYELEQKPESNIVLQFSDSATYSSIGEAIANGDFSGGQKVFYNNPGYGYFLGLIFYIFGKNYTVVRIFQNLINVLIIPLIFFICLKIKKNYTFAFASSIFAGFYGPEIFYTNTILIVSILPFLYVLFLLWYQHLNSNQLSKSYYAAGGFLCSIIIIFRPTLLLFLPVIFLFILFIGLKRPDTNFKKILFNIFIFIFFVIIPILPFTIYNYKNSGKFIFLTSNAGINFYIGNNPEATGFFSRPKIMETTAQKLKDKGITNPADTSKFWTKKAIDFILKNPDKFIKLTFKKFLMFIWNKEIPNNENYDYSYNESKVLPFSVINFNIIFPFSLIGFLMILYSLNKTNFTVFFPLLSIILYYIAITILFLVLSRYKTPIIPIICILSGYSIYKFISYIVRKNTKKTAIFIVVFFLIFFFEHFLNFNINTENNVQTIINKGLGYEKTGRFDKALEMYKKASQMDPNYPLAYYNIGTILFNKNKFKESLINFKAALKLNPDYTQAIFGLSKCYENLQDLKNALYYNEKAVEKGLKSADIMNNLAMLYAKTGNFNKAKITWENIINIYPNYKPAHDNLNKVLKLIKK